MVDFKQITFWIISFLQPFYLHDWNPRIFGLTYLSSYRCGMSRSTCSSVGTLAAFAFTVIVVYSPNGYLVNTIH